MREILITCVGSSFVTIAFFYYFSGFGFENSCVGSNFNGLGHVVCSLASCRIEECSGENEEFVHCVFESLDFFLFDCKWNLQITESNLKI